jgi:hypothetical protein
MVSYCLMVRLMSGWMHTSQAIIQPAGKPGAIIVEGY